MSLKFTKVVVSDGDYEQPVINNTKASGLDNTAIANYRLAYIEHTQRSPQNQIGKHIFNLSQIET